MLRRMRIHSMYNFPKPATPKIDPSGNRKNKMNIFVAHWIRYMCSVYVLIKWEKTSKNGKNRYIKLKKCVCLCAATWTTLNEPHAKRQMHTHKTFNTNFSLFFNFIYMACVWCRLVCNCFLVGFCFWVAASHVHLHFLSLSQSNLLFEVWCILCIQYVN